MRSAITDVERAKFERDGFVVLRDVLDQYELASWRGRLDKAIEWRRRNPPAGALGELDANEKFNTIFVQQVDLWRTNPEVRELFLAPELAGMCGDLIGRDELRLWFSSVMTKRPFADVTRYHMDGRQWPFEADRACTIWLGLDDADETNGCLAYLPGSHEVEASAVQAHAETDVRYAIGGLFDYFPAHKGIQPAFCPVRAGDAVVHNALTIHGATANMTPKPRRAITCSYMPASPIYNGYQTSLLRGTPPMNLTDDDVYPTVHGPAAVHVGAVES